MSSLFLANWRGPAHENCTISVVHFYQQWEYTYEKNVRKFYTASGGPDVAVGLLLLRRRFEINSTIAFGEAFARLGTTEIVRRGKTEFLDRKAGQVGKI